MRPLVLSTAAALLQQMKLIGLRVVGWVMNNAISTELQKIRISDSECKESVVQGLCPFILNLKKKNFCTKNTKKEVKRISFKYVKPHVLKL